MVSGMCPPHSPPLGATPRTMAEIKLNIVINNGYNAQLQAEEEPQARNLLSMTCYRESEGQEQHRKLRESVSRFQDALPESSYKCVGAPIQRDILGWWMLSPAPEGQEEKQVLSTSEVQQGLLQETGCHVELQGRERAGCAPTLGHLRG